MNKCINISLGQMKTEWKAEWAERLKGICPRQPNQCGLLPLLQAFSSQHRSLFSLWISAVFQLRT